MKQTVMNHAKKTPEFQAISHLQPSVKKKVQIQKRDPTSILLIPVSS